MGREAIVDAEVGGAGGEVKALLESHELILRGVIKRRYPRGRLEQVTVEDDALCFTHAGERVRLHLGARAAQAWAIALASPPPSLAAKLGLAKGARALLLGTADDDALAEALVGALADDAVDAQLLIARVDSLSDLEAARAVQAERGLPLWAVYPKGRGVTFGDTQIRAHLRAAGLRDTKSCAVSDRLTATRYDS